MVSRRSAPPTAREAAPMAATRGWFDGEWFTEEDGSAVRLGLRIDAELHEEHSSYQKINVYQTSFFGRVLVLDDVIMLTERDEFVYHEMLTHVPLCALPAPASVLIIGGGDCGSAREALKHPCVERVVQCEIDERVTRVCERYLPWVAKVVGDPRLELVFDDGVRYVADHRGSFDVIVIDSTDPKGFAVELFRKPFYEHVARALKPGGVLTAQGESPHWDSALVADIYRQLRGTFRHAAGYLCSIPSYPSGCWNLVHASNETQPGEVADLARAERVASGCRYYNPSVHRGAFALPEFVRQIIEDGLDPFARFPLPAGETKKTG